MRYNIFDLYEGAARGDRLKAIALKLEYKKPSSGNLDEDIDEAKLLSGLHPSILSLLQFEVKLKPMQNIPISELMQDIHFKNAIFNIATNTARLQQLFNDYQMIYQKEDEIKNAINELKELEQLEKQLEKQHSDIRETIQRQIEAQNSELQKMIDAYNQQRTERIKALQETIKELNKRQRELIAIDEELLNVASEQYANRLDDIKNAQGQPIMSGLSQNAKKEYARGVLDDFFKIERKYEKKEKEIDSRIAEIDLQLATLQNGNATKTTSFNNAAGTVSTAFRLHSERSSKLHPERNGSSPKAALESERRELMHQKRELPHQKALELEQAVAKNAQKVGKDLSKEEIAILKEHALTDKAYQTMNSKRNIVHDEVEVVQKTVEHALEEVQDIKEGRHEIKEGRHEIKEGRHEIKEGLQETKEVSKAFADLLEFSIDEQKDSNTSDMDLNFGGLDDDFDLNGIEEDLMELKETGQAFLKENVDSSASLRTKLN